MAGSFSLAIRLFFPLGIPGLGHKVFFMLFISLLLLLLSLQFAWWIKGI
jgi:hypothetical protein